MSGHSEEFAPRILMMEGETLWREERVGTFVAALVELHDGGYMIRIAQPRVIDRGESTNPRIPLVAEVGPFGAAGYTRAALKFNELVDETLK